MDVLGATVAVRATPGNCPGGGASIETTTNGGGSWSGVGTPADQVLRVTWAAPDNLWFVGASGEACDPFLLTSVDSAASWGEPEPADAAWHPLSEPTSPQLHAPNANVESPCAPAATLELEPVSVSSAFVLCDGGDVYETRDSAGSWSPVGTAPGAIALGLVDASPLVAIPRGTEACDGLEIRSFASEDIACVDGADASGVALAFAEGGVGFLLSGSATYTTADGGASWSQSG